MGWKIYPDPMMCASSSARCLSPQQQSMSTKFIVWRIIALFGCAAWLCGTSPMDFEAGKLPIHSCFNKPSTDIKHRAALMERTPRLEEIEKEEKSPGTSVNPHTDLEGSSSRTSQSRSTEAWIGLLPNSFPSPPPPPPPQSSPPQFEFSEWHPVFETEDEAFQWYHYTQFYNLPAHAGFTSAVIQHQTPNFQFWDQIVRNNLHLGPPEMCPPPKPAGWLGVFRHAMDYQDWLASGQRHRDMLAIEYNPFFTEPPANTWNPSQQHVDSQFGLLPLVM